MQGWNHLKVKKMINEVIAEINKEHAHYEGIVSGTAVRQLNDKFNTVLNAHEYMLLFNAVTETRKYCLSVISTEFKKSSATIQNQK